MKELSIEQKARRYDEAIEKAKEYYKEGKTLEYANDIVSDIFPELRESEDEKIRKEMISYFKQINYDNAHTWNGINLNKFVAWLEKQGESDETKAKIFLINNGYPIDSNGKFPTYEEMYNIIREGFEKQGEQPQGKSALEAAKEEKVDNQNCVKPTDKVEPKFKVGDKIYLKPEYRMPDDDTPIANTVKEIIRIDDKHYRFDGSYIFIEDQDKYELVEQTPAWSEEDTKELDSVFSSAKHVLTDDNKKWLQSLKDRVILQPKQEWSEEDEKNLEKAIWYVEKGGKLIFAETDKLVSWFKSLKDRVQPQSKWSEEDATMLNDCVCAIQAADEVDYSIEDKDLLINWLKSLRPHSQWKPSKHELEVLRLAAEKDGACLMGLYEDLKKLREEDV